MKHGYIILVLVIMVCATVNGQILDEYTVKTDKNILIYSYPRFFINDTNQYEEINENFVYESGVYKQPKKNLYKVSAPNGLEEFINVSGNRFRVYELKIDGKKQNIKKYNPIIKNNSIIYHVNPLILASFTYLPEKFKSKIVINMPQIKVVESISISYQGDNIHDKMYIYDSKNLYWIINASVNGDIYTFDVNENFENVTLPLTIDPEISLKQSNTEFDSYVYPYSDPRVKYRRGADNDEYIRFGQLRNPIIVDLGWARRGTIRYNLTAIENISVHNASLHFYIEETNYVNTSINFTHMAKYEWEYPNTNLGNEKYHNDTRNGTQYGTIDVSGSNETYYVMKFSNESDFVNDLKLRQSSGKDDFAFGMRVTQEVGQTTWWNVTRIGDSAHSGRAKRHYLNITYFDDCIPSGTTWIINKTCFYENETVNYERNIIMQTNATIILSNATLNLTKPMHIRLIKSDKIKFKFKQGSKVIFNE